jgi:hypothetical protein
MTTLMIIDRHNDFKGIINDLIFSIANYEKLQEFVNNTQYDEIFEKLYCNEEEGEDEDWPDEFLDPITCTKIKEPCLLPGMSGSGFDELYFERSTILKQLLVKSENPYTRAELTQEEFEKYNDLEEVKQKINLFKEKMLNYKHSI